MISIIIPTYNEKDNIGTLLGEVAGVLENRNQKYEIVVVDDSSPDGTADIVSKIKEKNKNVRLLTRSKKEGLGAAYKFAIPKAHGDLIMEMDADFSHNPKYLPDFIDASKNADIVIGSRKIAGGKRKDSLKRRIFPAIGSFLFRIAGCPVKDPTSGYRVYKKKITEKIDFENLPDDYSFQVAVLFEAKALGASFLEIPIDFEKRVSGQTKYTNRDLFGNIRVLWSVLFRRKH